MDQTSLPVKREYKPSPYATQYLLLAYKTGFYLSDKDAYSKYAADALFHLEANKYIITIQITNRHRLIALTQLGVDYVKQHFEERLRTGFLYHIHPILLPEDTIEVTKTLENDPFGMCTFVRSPHAKLPKGLYTMRRVDRYSIHLVSQETNEDYKVRTYQSRDFLKLKISYEITNIEEEMCKRFGYINVKYTSKQLGNKIKDNLQLVKIMSQLLELPAAQGRIIGMK